MFCLTRILALSSDLFWGYVPACLPPARPRRPFFFSCAPPRRLRPWGHVTYAPRNRQPRPSTAIRILPDVMGFLNYPSLALVLQGTAFECSGVAALECSRVARPACLGYLFGPGWRLFPIPRPFKKPLLSPYLSNHQRPRRAIDPECAACSRFFPANDLSGFGGRQHRP